MISSLRNRRGRKFNLICRLIFCERSGESIHQYSGELLKKEQEKAAVEQELLRQTLQVQIDKLEVDNMKAA